MKYYFHVVIIFTWLLISGTDTLYSQNSDTVLLAPVSIHETRHQLFLTGKNVITLDSASLSLVSHRNVGDVLSKTTGIFIKSYGAGSSSTLTSRGTEARHSSVLWNGFNLNSSSLGLADLSMIPLQVADGITVIHGGSTAINGNSAIGSTILLNKKEPTFSNSSNLLIDLESGSFGKYDGSIKMHISDKNIESSTTLFSNQAKNNFPFINVTHRDKPEMKLQHAAYQNYGALQDLNFKILPNQFLSASVWYQVTHREIPPMMTVPVSKAEQTDSLLRLFAGYKIILKESVLRVNAGYFREFQYYNDSQFNIDKDYELNSYFADADWRWNVASKLIVTPGFSYNQTDASFKEYDETKHRKIFALYLSTIYNIYESWKLNLNIRRDFSNTENPPLAPSFGIEGNLYKTYVILKANIGRHFSIPAMNDLYWTPGGNPDLLPEDALSTEGGFVFFKNHKFLPIASIMAFHSVVDNWIKWTPGHGSIYTPENISQVKTKGIETSLHYQKKYNNWQTTVSINYTWCESTISQTDEIYGEHLIGKQIMHTPVHSGGMVLTTEFRGYGANLYTSLTGSRFTSGDNISHLKGYSHTELVLFKKVAFKNHKMQIYARVSNLFNATYQVMAYRPTPGRWFSGGVKFNLNLKTSNKITESKI